MIGTVLVGRLCRDETLSEEEQLRRINNVTRIWSEISRIVEGKEEQIFALDTDVDYSVEGVTDELLAVIKELFVYGVLKLAFEGKDGEPNMSQKGIEKEISEFLKDVVKERDEVLSPILNVVSNRIN